MLIFNSVPVSYRTECTFIHLMTRRCCQPCLATNMPDVIHTACLPLPPRPRPGEQVPAGAQGARLGPGEPWRRKTGRPTAAPFCGLVCDPWLHTSALLGFVGEPARLWPTGKACSRGFAMSGAALGPGPGLQPWGRGRGPRSGRPRRASNRGQNGGTLGVRNPASKPGSGCVGAPPMRLSPPQPRHPCGPARVTVRDRVCRGRSGRPPSEDRRWLREPLCPLSPGALWFKMAAGAEGASP